MLTLAIATIAVSQTFAQNEVDALRYSRLTLGGTARFTATGGAFGAVGADFSSLGINPAGIGIYKKSEITFTPSIYMGNSNSSYNGQSMSEGRSNFNLGNFGMIFSMNTDNGTDKPGWKNVNFGFGFNKYNNYNNRVSIQGSNTESSLLTDYTSMAQGSLPKDLSNYTTGLAFNTYLIDTIPGNQTSYFSAIPLSGGVLQNKTIETTGAINEMVFSMGGNYSEKLYLGITVGVPYAKYNQISSYKETDDGDSIPNFKSFTINDEVKTNGTGLNFKFGMIYRITDWVRIGMAVHTPTSFNLHDSFSRSIEARYDNKNYTDEAPKGTFNYNVTTPMRAIGSIAFLINKMGFISADYEFVDYSTARLNSSNYMFNSENAAVQNYYTSAGNLHIGTEWNLSPIIIRAGYSMYGTPYKPITSTNTGNSSAISAGIGLREEQYFLDISYVYSMQSEDYYLYNRSLVNPATIDFNSHTLLFTFGIKY